MTTVEAFVPAKVNLTLHVTGQRDDGYHTLDSLAMFADIGDRMTITMPGDYKLTVEGPMAEGVPGDESNLVLRAARMMRINADIRLEKHLPNAAGLGGGSGDAAATLRVLSGFSGKPVPGDGIELGADVPLCLQSEAARVTGIGDTVTPVPNLPPLHAVLVNPRLPVLTAEVFKRLKHKVNRPMPDEIPAFDTPAELIAWLRGMRNDLQEPAIEAEPVIRQVFETLEKTPGCQLARMSGSGGTCFGIYKDAETAGSAAGRLQESFPSWWVQATRLNGPYRSA
ncbi:4-(cytidine 5'-diphospho)-2-C-methyl-D-erythritol kinase [Roseovarius indicus]|uniref:4-(cytidine 5'-diphospho)-2-C-methyl-D-erythritol kinase n=1 Tax=Roseovarius indicus TaxID=540747 RepID=UPI0007D9D5BA|nr:4-(cytidine 5'-diphospho)-2-C-methyl-D-erythritol kinase [Roseovarius indicus]OAO00472.1 4-(cytidine 5'-diphospho)-2-C-methyl-D-erythritol kinase [Roseovarius indicus]